MKLLTKFFLNTIDLQTWERTFLNFPTLFGLREIVTKENQ